MATRKFVSRRQPAKSRKKRIIKLITRSRTTTFVEYFTGTMVAYDKKSFGGKVSVQRIHNKYMKTKN